MTRWSTHLLLGLIIIILATRIKCSNFCGTQKHFQTPKGKIETSQEITDDLVNCTWSIITPKNSVILIKLEYLQLGSYDEKYEEQENCLHITRLDKKLNYLQICTDANYFDTLSLPTNELLISLEVTSESFLSLTYSSYIVNCSYNELKCYNSRLNSRKIEKTCTDGMLICENHCRYGSVICGEFCYDIHKQRCDGIVNCPSAEDELGCSPDECPNKIRCSHEPKCLTTDQICDEKVDCKNGFDESNCPNFFCKEDEPNCNIERSRERDFEASDIPYIVAIIFGVMTLLFIYLICRCLTKRGNVRNMMDNPLDVPLPPFRGPGENSSCTEDVLFTDDDFRPGGDIYESFTANLETIKNRRKHNLEEKVNDITYVKPPDKQSVLHKYFNGNPPVLNEDMAALATLKITRDMCHGLRKTKSEERPMTRLLFIDNNDDVSDDSDLEDQPSTNVKKPPYAAAHSKSDTYYVRRKNVRVNFV